MKRDERARLEKNYDKLCSNFPVVARCSKAKFIQSLMDVTISWTDRINESSRKNCLETSAASSLLSPYAPTSLFFGSPGIPQPMLMQHVPAFPFGMRMSYDMSLRASGVCQDVCAGGLPGDRCHAIDACSTGACSGEASPYDSGDDAVVVGGEGEEELNAGEAVDMKLFRHWTTSEAGLLVDAGELEQFGRSKSVRSTRGRTAPRD